MVVASGMATKAAMMVTEVMMMMGKILDAGKVRCPSAATRTHAVAHAVAMAAVAFGLRGF